MEKGPIQVKMKLAVLTMMVIMIMDHIMEVIRTEEDVMGMGIMRTITTIQDGSTGHHGSNSYTHNEDYKHSHQHQGQPRYSHSHYRHDQNRGGGEVCSQPPNIQDLFATSVVATSVLTLQAGGNININENNCRETKHIHSRNPHAHFQCPCDHGCNGFTTLMETHLQGDTCVGNYSTQGTVNLNSPCGGGGSYIRHMQVTGEGQLNVINKSGSHSVLNVERDINIDTLTCDTLVIVDWSY